MPNRIISIAAFSGLMMILPFTAEASVDGQADKSARVRTIISYSVSNNSWLSLKGTTNINSFECLSSNAVPNNNIIVKASHEKEKLSFSNAVILVEVGSFDCKNPLINRDMYKALGGTNDSFIEIKLLEVKPTSGNWYTHDGNLTASLEISINGISRIKEMKIDWQNAGGIEYHFIGRADISMSDFDIDPPSPALGMVKVNDSITVSFNYSVKSEEISRLD